jgi:hypothetical protein
VSGVTELMQKVFTLTSGVDGLKSDVKRMNEMLLMMHERIIRLEGSSELTAEKAKNAALMAVQATHNELLRELLSLRARLDANPSLPLPAASGFRLGSAESKPADPP